MTVSWALLTPVSLALRLRERARASVNGKYFHLTMSDFSYTWPYIRPILASHTNSPPFPKCHYYIVSPSRLLLALFFFCTILDSSIPQSWPVTTPVYAGKPKTSRWPLLWVRDLIARLRVYLSTVRVVVHLLTQPVLFPSNIERCKRVSYSLMLVTDMLALSRLKIKRLLVWGKQRRRNIPL